MNVKKDYFSILNNQGKLNDVMNGFPMMIRDHRRCIYIVEALFGRRYYT